MDDYIQISNNKFEERIIGNFLLVDRGYEESIYYFLNVFLLV